MQTKRCAFLRKSLAMALAAALTASTLPSRGWAMLAPADTKSMAGAEVGRAEDVKTIQTALETKEVRQRLAELWLSPEQIDGRLAQLSDAELHQTAAQIRALHPGGDGGVISILIVVVLVLFIVYLFQRV